MPNTFCACCVAALMVVVLPSALAQEEAPSRTARLAADDGVMVYTTRAAFEAACGRGLPTETFEEANVAPGDSAVFQGPLRAATDNAIFGRRTILYDMQVDADSADSSTDLFVLGVDEASSVQVGNKNPSHNLDLEFGPATTCVGFDVETRRGKAVQVTAFDESVSILGSTAISGAASQFVGFKSTVPRMIRRVRIGTAAVLERAEVDNLSFGNEGPFNVVLNALSSTTVTPGGLARLKYTVTNQTASPLDGGLFFYVEQDDVTVAQGPVVITTLTVGQMSKVYTQPVPGAARPGAYDYFICVGPNIAEPIMCSDPLAVTVTDSQRERR